MQLGSTANAVSVYGGFGDISHIFCVKVDVEIWTFFKAVYLSSLLGSKVDTVRASV